MYIKKYDIIHLLIKKMEKELNQIEVDSYELSARELVQRHQITSTSSMPFSSPKRTSLLVTKVLFFIYYLIFF